MPKPSRRAVGRIWGEEMLGHILDSKIHVGRSLLLLFSHSAVFDSLRPCGLQDADFSVLHYFLKFAQTHVYWVVMPSNHLILCHPLLLLPSTFPSIRVFSNESALCIGWPKYWSFSLSPSYEYWEEIVPGFSTTVSAVFNKMSYTEKVLSKYLLNKALCLQDSLCIFCHKCWSKCFWFAFLWVCLPFFTVNPGGYVWITIYIPAS